MNKKNFNNKKYFIAFLIIWICFLQGCGLALAPLQKAPEFLGMQRAKTFTSLPVWNKDGCSFYYLKYVILYDYVAKPRMNPFLGPFAEMYDADWVASSGENISFSLVKVTFANNKPKITVIKKAIAKHLSNPDKYLALQLESIGLESKQLDYTPKIFSNNPLGNRIYNTDKSLAIAYANQDLGKILVLDRNKGVFSGDIPVAPWIKNSIFLISPNFKWILIKGEKRNNKSEKEASELYAVSIDGEKYFNVFGGNVKEIYKRVSEYKKLIKDKKFKQKNIEKHGMLLQIKMRELRTPPEKDK